MFRNRDRVNLPTSGSSSMASIGSNNVGINGLLPTSNFLKTSKSLRKSSMPGLNKSNDSVLSEGILLPEKDNKIRTLVMIFSTLDEFSAERELLRAHVLPELQQNCCDRDVDLECLTLYETGDLIENIEQLYLLQHLLSHTMSPSIADNIYVLCFIGDKYGEAMLPLEMRTDEYAGIQAAASELSSDAALLEQFYGLRKEADRSVYRLKPTTSRDPEAARRLCILIQEASTKAFQDGSIYQINESRQDYFHKSFIETLVDVLLENSKNHTFVTRKLAGYQPADVECWVDSSKVGYAKVAELKNRISSCLSSGDGGGSSINHFPFIFNLAGVNAARWLKSKEFLAYERQLTQKLIDRLKHVFAIAAPIPNTHFSVFTPAKILNSEHVAHESVLLARTPVNWVARPALDAKLDEIVDAIFAQKPEANYYHFYGGDGCGKSALLCRLRQLIQKRADEIAIAASTSEKQITTNKNSTTDNAANIDEFETCPLNNCIVMSRFVCLTECSAFANELFRNIFLKASDLAKLPEELTAMSECFYLHSVFLRAEYMMRNFPCPLVILIDDAHLLRYGSVLSKIEKAIFDRLPSNLTIVLFSNVANLPQGFPKGAQLIDIPFPNQTLAIDILRDGHDASTNFGILRQNFNFVLFQPTKLKNGNTAKKKKSSAVEEEESPAISLLIMGSVQRDELLDGQQEISIDLNARFALIELRCGAENLRIVSQLISCCAPFGISRIELSDSLRLRKRTIGMSFEPDDVINASAPHVLRHLGSLISYHFVNGRELITFSHMSVLNFVRSRYLQSAGEIKLTHETLARVIGNPTHGIIYDTTVGGTLTTNDNEAITACLLFPQPLCKENGIVNLRRVRFHWYYLLYTGNIAALKTETLCSFDYLESAFRGCGLAHLLTMFEECLLQILDHDLLAIFEKVLIPSIPTLTRDPHQFVSEFLNRLRYTRSKNNIYLNNFVEQAMHWTDNYNEGPLFVPLTCWIPPPKTKEVISFTIPDWKSSKTVLQPTYNHQHLLIAGNDANPGIIYMFHIASQQLRQTLYGHESRVSFICTSRDGQFFVSCAYDGSIKIWNIAQSEECIKTLKVSDSRILCALLSADDKWVVIGSVDSTARVVSIESGVVLRTFRDHTGPVVGLQLSSDNELLITGSGDFVVMVWDIEKSTIILKMGGLMAPVTCLAITSNDAFLAVACEDETLRIFSMVSSQELHELSGHDSRVNALAVSSDDCQLFAATRGKVIIYDIHNAQLLEVLPCQASIPVTSLKISDDNSFILAACGDRVHMWNMNSIERDSFQNDCSSLACICISPDEKGAGCGTIDGIIAFWDLDVCQCLWTLSQQKTGAVTALDFTVDSLYLLGGNAQGGISMWEVATGQFIKQLQVHSIGEVTSITCLADSFRVLSVDKSCQAQLWNLSTFVDEAFAYASGSGPSGIGNSSAIIQFSGSAPLPSLPSDDLFATIPDLRPPIFVRYSAISESFIVVGQNSKKYKEINIWSVNIESRVVLKAKIYHNYDIICYHVNRSGTALVTGGSVDKSLKVWQPDSGFLTQALVGHTEDVTCCCIAEDAQLVVSGGRDKQIIVWNVSMGTITRAINTAFPLMHIELSQDSTVILSADKNGWIEAWEAMTGKLLSSFNTHRRIQQLIMNIDGNRILARLSQTAQLPILCLHNTPATLVPVCASKRKFSNNNQRPQGANLARLQSNSSFTSDVNMRGEEIKTKKISNTADTGTNAETRPGSALSARSRRAQQKDAAGEKKFGESDVTAKNREAKADTTNNTDLSAVTANGGTTTNRKSAACLIL